LGYRKSIINAKSHCGKKAFPLCNQLSFNQHVISQFDPQICLSLVSLILKCVFC